MAEYTCTPQGLCIQCNEGDPQALCANGYKQKVDCAWNNDADHKGTVLPEFQPCASLDGLEKRAFFRNHLTFVILGFLAFAVFVWRRKRVFYE
ncbi:hypothetical protein GGF46_005271 [Coemansia sp. RSA 552]|nr:hypothetical protein GGF46_005271 [Coemansia sp. RSA 552]